MSYAYLYKSSILILSLAFSFISLSSHCQNVTNIGGVINSYTPVLSFYICTNEITVEDGSQFNIGDTVLLIQMKGALIDTSNTSAFGNITDYKNSGNYSINYIKGKSGNVIKLKNILKRQFDIPTGKVQLIRVPYYKNVNIISTLTCLSWDGNKGGVLILNVQDTIILNADIDISGRGFRGGIIDNHSSPCHETDYFFNSLSDKAGFKGEGIALFSNNISKGRGKVANGGGAGNAHNAGGAGGGNFGSGGLGGKEYLCINTPPQVINGGIGGSSLVYSSVQNRIFLGGGGGAGDENDNLGSSGGNGGGIAITSSKFIRSNSFKIYNNGNTSSSCLGFPCGDGGGGGGAGGSLFLNINNYIDNLNLFTIGGNGGSLNNPVYHGVGGGGSGGVLFLNSPTLPINIIQNNQGGLNGFEINTGETGGAQNGSSGGNIYNVNIPIDTEPFFDLPNINATKVNDINCNNPICQLMATGAIQYSWSPATSLNNPNLPNPIATPSTNTLYTVTGTDLNGCINKDTISVFVDLLIPTVKASKLNDINCDINSSQLNAIGAVQYSWSPTLSLNNPNFQNPIATPTVTTMYTVTGTAINGCINTDTLLIYVDFQKTGEYFVPNAFTPNNDGLNDCIRIKYWGTILEFEFNIYNRWGERVFHSTDPSKCWDGNLNGEKQKADVYVYWIRAKTPCTDKVFKKGTIVLIR